MKYRDVERALLANGCTWKQGKGDHIKWYCPSSCGKHVAVVTQARNVSAGVVADTITNDAVHDRHFGQANAGQLSSPDRLTSIDARITVGASYRAPTR